MKMAKFQQNHHQSLVLDHTAPAADGNFKLWSSCRRKIIDAMRCSGGISRQRKSVVKSPATENLKLDEPECRSDRINNGGNYKGSEKLSTLMRRSESSSEKLKELVKRLQSDGDGDAAKEVRELAKEDSVARTNFALLGAIPPLVSMLDSGDLVSQISALYALLNLGIGNELNKSAIVEAGAVHKMLALVESPAEDHLLNPDLSAAIVANFLGLSALDSNKPIIGSSGAISYLVKTLKNLTKTNNNSQVVVQDSLKALYNLSLLPSNVLPMIEIDDCISFLLTMMGDSEVSDRILSILSNVVSTPEGRRAVSTARDAFVILVDVLNWMDLPNCQEKAVYILMVMAHKSYADRQAMIKVGIMSSLLELTLLGSSLAQKRSSRILEILRINKGKQVSEDYEGSVGMNVSAPLCGSTDTESVDPTNNFPNNNAVKYLVEQSLQSNMRRIVKRANLPQELVRSEHLKSSMASFTSSRSLPF